jgi:hypothetical protein
MYPNESADYMEYPPRARWGAPMTDEIQWMNHIRRTYIQRVSLMALEHGLTLAEAPSSPQGECQDLWDGRGEDLGEHACLYLLVDRATGEQYSQRGVTLGQIEDHLKTGIHSKVPVV